ncbi:MAG: hypothetical protein HQ522_21060 [Bacteroidetes bacterium]|nr:hypothetical protein [Bacteroidota bacterium]
MSAIKEYFHDKIESGMRIAKQPIGYNTPVVQTIGKILETPVSKNQPVKRNPVT